MFMSGVGPGAQLPLAIFVIVWVSGITSGFVDNIPFATMMVPIINSLSRVVSVTILGIFKTGVFGHSLRN